MDLRRRGLLILCHCSNYNRSPVFWVSGCGRVMDPHGRSENPSTTRPNDLKLPRFRWSLCPRTTTRILRGQSCLAKRLAASTEYSQHILTCTCFFFPGRQRSRRNVGGHSTFIADVYGLQLRSNIMKGRRTGSEENCYPR